MIVRPVPLVLPTFLCAAAQPGPNRPILRPPMPRVVTSLATRVSVSGDTIVVGAWKSNQTTVSNSGAYRRW